MEAFDLVRPAISRAVMVPRPRAHASRPPHSIHRGLHPRGNAARHLSIIPPEPAAIRRRICPSQ